VPTAEFFGNSLVIHKCSEKYETACVEFYTRFYINFLQVKNKGKYFHASKTCQKGPTTLK